MICTTIQNKTIDEILGILESGTVEMAEIRLDRCPLSMEDIEELFSTSDVPLVATCRISEVRKRIVAANPDMDARKSTPEPFRKPNPNSSLQYIPEQRSWTSK